MTTPPASVNNTPITMLLILMVCGWLAVLFVESSLPPAAFMAKVPGLDKIAHFLAFGVLGLLVCAVSFRLNPRPAISLFSMPLAVATLSGIIEESYQLFIPGRTASLPDLLADVCGAVFSIVVANRIAQSSRACGSIRS